MTPTLLGHPRARVAGVGLLIAIAVPGLAPLPALSDPAPAPSGGRSPDQVVTLADTPLGLADVDARGTAVVADAQRAAAESRGLRVSSD